ncbi:MAG: outer membrane beta-barrel protein [Muribaculaceae bacterium]|nr:outer membrane beta-barrel protein [Muribaculaceae bacterium]
MKHTSVHSLIRNIAVVVMLLVCVCTRSTASAQSAPYKFAMGADLGMSGYIGDASRSNPFAHPGFGADLSFSYLPDVRWNIRTALSTFGLSGNTSDVANVLPEQAEYSFTSQVYELSARAEFNFFPYGIGETYKRLRRWTPYLALGVGVGLATSDGNTAAAFTLPMAFGFRFKVRPRLNLGIEFSMTKAFSDHFDGKQLADLNQIKTAFYKNTDWYSRISVGISYEFGERCETCHYVD